MTSQKNCGPHGSTPGVALAQAHVFAQRQRCDGIQLVLDVHARGVDLAPWRKTLEGSAGSTTYHCGGGLLIDSHVSHC